MDMSWKVRISGALAGLFLVAPAAAAARFAPINGKLSQPGYTVIALAADMGE